MPGPSEPGGGGRCHTAAGASGGLVSWSSVCPPQFVSRSSVRPREGPDHPSPYGGRKRPTTPWSQQPATRGVRGSVGRFMCISNGARATSPSGRRERLPMAGPPDSLRLRLRLRLGRAAQREDARAQGPTALAANAEAQTQGTHTVGRGLPARARSGRQRGPRDRVSRPAGWAALHCHQDSGGLTAAVRVLGGHEAEFPELGAEDPSVASF